MENNKELLICEYLNNLELPSLISKINEEKFRDFKSLHASFKSKKYSCEKYYSEFYPRWDIMTRQKIEFADFESYFEQYFTDKKRLNTFLISYASNELKELMLSRILMARRILKGYNYFPGEAEADSFGFPTITKLRRLGLSIINISKLANTPARYSYDKELTYREFAAGEIIIQDSREKDSLRIKEKVIVEGLKYGDYRTNDFNNKIVVERKSLSDGINSLSKGYERLDREFVRAAADSCNIVVLVETNLSNAKNFPLFIKHSKASPQFILHRMRELIHKHSHVQFLFVDGRIEAAKIVPKLLKINNINDYDLQHLYNGGLLC